MKEYALYKGEDLLSVGTISEIAKETGVKRDTIAFYKTPTYQKRLSKRKNIRNARMLIELDEED